MWSSLGVYVIRVYFTYDVRGRSAAVLGRPGLTALSGSSLVHKAGGGTHPSVASVCWALLLYQADSWL